MFPIQAEREAQPHPMRVPWNVAELAYSVYAGRYGRGQSLERLAERGGFAPSEMDMFVPDWREQCDTIVRQAAEIERQKAKIETLRDVSGCPPDTTLDHWLGVLHNCWVDMCANEVDVT